MAATTETIAQASSPPSTVASQLTRTRTNVTQPTQRNDTRDTFKNKLFGDKEAAQWEHEEEEGEGEELEEDANNEGGVL